MLLLLVAALYRFLVLQRQIHLGKRPPLRGGPANQRRRVCILSFTTLRIGSDTSNQLFVAR